MSGSSFFTRPTDTIHHNGRTIGVISNGDIQSAVNEKLAAEVEELKAKKAEDTITPAMSTSNLKNDSGFGATDLFVDSGKKVTVTTTPGSNTISVFYNLSDALGTDEKILSNVIVEGNRNGVQAVLVDSNKISNSFSIAPDNFPATISFDLRTKNDTAQNFLSAKITLDPTGSNASYALQSRKFGKSELQTQTQVNDYFYNTLQSVSASNTSSVALDGETVSIQEAISKLWLAIKELQAADLSSTRVSYQNSTDSSGNVTKTISEALSEISAKINTL